MLVQSPTWYSGLRIQHCHNCGIGCDCSSDLILGLGAPYATGQPKMEGDKRGGAIWKENKLKIDLLPYRPQLQNCIGNSSCYATCLKRNCNSKELCAWVNRSIED